MNASRRAAAALLLALPWACSEEEAGADGACYGCSGIGSCSGPTSADDCAGRPETRWVEGRTCESGQALAAALERECSAPSGGGASCDDAPEGAYRCAEGGATAIERCEDGAWRSAGTCGCSVRVGDPRKPAYAATCKHLIGSTHAIECSYADVDCKQCLAGEDCETTCTPCASSSSSNCCP